MPHTESECGTLIPDAGHVRVCTTEAEFVSVWPAQPSAATALWEAIADGDAVGILLEESIGKRLTQRSTRGVIARIERQTGEGTDEGGYLLRSGSAAREVFGLITRRDRLREIRDAARWGESDDVDDVGRLTEQVESLTEQISQRDALRSAFDREWIPRAAVEKIVASSASTEQPPAVDNDRTQQTGLGEVS